MEKKVFQADGFQHKFQRNKTIKVSVVFLVVKLVPFIIISCYQRRYPIYVCLMTFSLSQSVINFLFISISLETMNFTYLSKERGKNYGNTCNENYIFLVLFCKVYPLHYTRSSSLAKVMNTLSRLSLIKP